MIPGTLNITIYRGDDYSMIFRMKDSVTNTYVDLRERTGRAHIRAEALSDVILDSFTVTILDQVATPGGVMLSLSPAQTAALPLSGGVYDVELFNATRTWVRTPLAGRVIVVPEVTR